MTRDMPASFVESLEAGAVADMDWIARGAEKRCDPQKVLTSARSVVSLAMNYWQGDRDRGYRAPLQREAASPAMPGVTITMTCWRKNCGRSTAF